MKKITLAFFMMILPFLGFAQTFNEGFEGATFPPTAVGNWITMDNGVGTAISWAETTDITRVNSGLKAAIMDRENVGAGNTSQDWLITHQFTVPANGQFRFYTRQTLVGNNGSTYELRVSTNPTQTNQAAFTTIQSWTETTLNAVFNVYEEKAVSLSAYAGQQVYVAFVKINTQPTGTTSGDRWLIDDVRLVQQCLDPTILTVGTITPTSAVLGWTNNGTATAWEVAVQTPGSGTPTGPGTAAGTNPFTATGLTPGTAYEYYVRANCGSGNFSNWVGPFNFNTTPAGSICSAPIVVGGLPYSHTANTNTYGDEVDTPQGAGCAGGATNYMQGAEVFYTFTPTFTGNVTINMTPTGNSSSIFVYNGCANVGVSCLAGVADATANPRNITLPVTAGQTYVIVISSSTTPAAGIPYTLIIQQFTCTPPGGLTAANIGTTSADLSWTNPTGATAWEVAVQPAGSPIPAGAGSPATTNTNFPVTGLTAATAYQYWVRADCGGGIFSAWAGPFLFNTNVCEAAQRCNYTFRLTDSFGDGWNGARMEVRQNGVVVATLGATFTTGAGPVNIVVPLCETLPFELYWTVAGSFPSEVGISVINNFAQTLFTKPAGTGGASTTTPLYSTSFSCSTPACLPPTALTATTLTTTGATLGWNATATGATSWDIYVVPTGSPAPTAATVPTFPGVTTNPFVVNTLLPGTTYQFYVRSVCTATSSSIWAGPVAFTTLPTCAIPTALTVTGITPSSAVLNWTQPVNPGGSLATSWQLIILPCGSPTPTAATPGWITVNTRPYNALGLTPLSCYDYYVRAVCSATDSSPISPVKSFNTPDLNDECINAKLVPVNQNTHCSQTVYGSVAGATASPQPNTCGATADDDDVWFYFTATATTHYISLLEPVLPQTSNAVNFPTTFPGGLNYALYRGTNCSALTQVSCRTSNGNAETGLIPGETYYVRVYSPGTTASTKVFEICVGTKVIDCSSSFPLCAISPIVIRNDVGVAPNPNPISGTTSTTVGCLGSAPSPTFYFLTIPQNGNYRFFLEQSTRQDFSTVDLDVDFVTWGPYPSVAAACSAISVNNTRPHSTNPLVTANGCDYSANPTETFSLFGAVAGEVYIVMITNFTSFTPPGKRGWIRITQQAGPIPTVCCPYTNFTYSSSFFCKDGVNPLPTLTSGATAGTYSCPNPALVLNPTTGEINLAASAVGTYLITSTIASAGTCPTATSSWSVTISNPPSASIAYSAPSYCSNDTTLQNVTITGTTGGFFSTVPTGMSINPTTGAFTPSTSAPGIYTVNYTKPAAAGCPQYVASTTVEIKALPIATFTYGAAPYCQNSGSITPTFTGGGTAGVFSATPTGLSLNTTTGAIDLSTSAPGTYVVTNDIAAAGGCPNVSATASITITSLPVATFNYPNAIYCQAVGTATPVFTGGGIAGTFSSTPGLVINPTTGEVDLAASTTGVYTVTNTIPAANGCPQVIETAQITINPTPNATLVSSDADNTICSNETATLTVTPTNFVVADATYAWTLNTNPLTATGSQINVTATGVYEVTITLNGCTQVLSQSFTVNPLPVFTVTGTNLVKCVNETATLSVSPTNFVLTDPNATYSWTLDGGAPFATTSSVNVTGYGTYEVTVTLNGCPVAHSIVVSLDTTDIPINTVGECQGTNYIITASPVNGSYNANASAVTYEWSTASGVIPNSNTPTFNVTQYVNDQHIPTSSFPLLFTVKITTIPEGCTDTQSFTVITSVCAIPRGISPNNDGDNDTFDLRGLGVKKLSIFNRYGTKVYGFENYTNEWHGQSDKNQELPDGTYFYVVEQTSGETKSGWVYINR